MTEINNFFFLNDLIMSILSKELSYFFYYVFGMMHSHRFTIPMESIHDESINGQLRAQIVVSSITESAIRAAGLQRL